MSTPTISNITIKVFDLSSPNPSKKGAVYDSGSVGLNKFVDPASGRGGTNYTVDQWDDNSRTQEALNEAHAGEGTYPSYPISLTPNGAALSVFAGSGVALVGGASFKTVAGQNITNLQPSTTNYIFLLANRTFIPQLSANAPINSMYIGSITTNGTNSLVADITGQWLIPGWRNDRLTYDFCGAWQINRETKKVTIPVTPTANTDAANKLYVDTAVSAKVPQTQTRLSKSVAGGVDVTLSAGEASNRILEFTGVLTANINVIVPLTDGLEWIIFNNSTGAFTLTVKGSTGTGTLVAQGKRAIIYTDSTNVVRATADV